MQKADALLDRIYWRAGCLESVQVRFGGGQLETCLRSIVPVVRRHEDRQGAGCLPYFGHTDYPTRVPLTWYISATRPGRH